MIPRSATKNFSIVVQPTSLRVISSMATRSFLQDAAKAAEMALNIETSLLAMGGVDAAQRVRSGEGFDVVVLAQDALSNLATQQHIVPSSTRALARSGMHVAIKQGASVPDITHRQALKEAVLKADRIGYSTGPSGIHLLKCISRWGLTDVLGARVVQAPPGVPVARLIADGSVTMGFQQLSELIHAEGVQVIGPMPDEDQLLTDFCAGVGVLSTDVSRAMQWIDFVASPACDALRKREGLQRCNPTF
jgi:molybdate transport system substrate-binding protein